MILEDKDANSWQAEIKKQNIKLGVSDWMKRVMFVRKLNAAKWAKMANTSPTNITRFLDAGQFIPSIKILCQLNEAANTNLTIEYGTGNVYDQSDIEREWERVLDLKHRRF